MDDRRFDSLAKSLASGASRRSVLKGMLGLGGAALAGSVFLDGESEAARRPTPTPTPVRCPGNQVPSGGACICPATAPNMCGPTCCSSVSGGSPTPTHSECCDNACCFGTCYGEELCCPTNNRSGGDLPIPPTHRICDTVDGPECCPFDQVCCRLDGCCDTFCYGPPDGDTFCCATAQACPGGSESADVCCDANETCCGGGTNANTCIDLAVAGSCCDESDCEDRCLTCDLRSHTCVERCPDPTQVCCTGTAGPGQCVTGECCLAYPSCDPGEVCCQGAGGTSCVTGETCPAACSESDPCDGCTTCVRGFCRDGCSEGAVCCPATEGSDTCVAGNCCSSEDCSFIDACTTNTCQSNRCVAASIICDDGSGCTVDSCDPDLGCIYEPVNCDDGNACTHGECVPNLGCVNTSISCDDGDPCTTDYCDSVTGCNHVPIDCSGLDNPALCLEGVCVGGNCTTQSTCATGTACCEDGSCSDACICSADGAVCSDSTECCEGCCILNLPSLDDWTKVCSDAGLTGNAAALCAQAIVDQGYPSTCLSPPTVTFATFPENPVTLPCAV